MDYTALLYSILCMGGMGLLFSVGLSIAHKKLKVEEDPRIYLLTDLLPGANCGSCGYAGCANFAEHLASGEAQISSCPVCGIEAVKKIAEILGIEAEVGEKMVAVVMCQGGDGIVTKKAEYEGIQSCIAVTFANGGERACSYGCSGLGDCVESCPFDAIHMNDDNLAVVDREKCTGCGNCVEACPINIIEMHPVSHTVFVLCKNRDNPKAARKVCKRACIGCKICERAVQGEGFEVVDNLVIVDHEKYTRSELPTEKCPTKCIVVVGEKEEVLEANA